MSEEFKNSENTGAEQPEKKPFSVTIPEDDFVNDIPAPESEIPAEGKSRKVVRYVDNAPKTEKPQKSEKKKSGFVGEFFAGAAAGAKTVSEGISAGIKTISEKKSKAEKPAEEKPIKEKPVKAEKPEKVQKPVETDETQFPKDEKKVPALPPVLSGIMEKVNSLPTKTVIIGAAVLLVVLIAIILLAATSCSPSENTPSDVTPSGGEITIDPENPGNPENPNENPGETATDLEIPDREVQLAEAYTANNDVVGWLYIPGLEDVDAGVCFSYDKSYPYNKRDITGKKVPNSYWIEGAYYTHFRGLFGADSEDLSMNTVIFGHSDLGKENLSYTNDDPNGPLFSQLFSFKDPSFAEKTPYIYLTLPAEQTVWEVFAVFYNDAAAVKKTFSSYYKNNAGDLWYIEPAPSESEYALMLETAQKRSIYDYNVEVSTEDRILTLSTCTVGFGINNRDNYRFVVVAKLVEDTENITAKNASFTINADAPIPGTYKEDFEKYASGGWKPVN